MPIYGHDYQEKKPPGTITKNWNAAGGIRAGDWCVAYLKHSRFYAIGKVTSPRKQRIHQDTFERTQRDHRHIYLDGTVAYGNAEDAFYEDFTDEWDLPLNNPICASCKAHRGQRNEVWQYPQRIDVEKWEHWVQKGVPLKGLDKAVRSISGSYRIAAFKIPRFFFDKIRTTLRQAAGE